MTTVNQAGAPIYTALGARPQPTPDEAAARNPWRGPIILAVAMFGWMFLALALAASVTPAGTGGETVLRIGRGVTIAAPEGWTAAADIWDVGPNAVSLQKAGALVGFAAEAYAGTDRSLLAEQSSQVEAQFDSFRALPAASTVVAGNLQGLVVIFSGAADSGRLEGELVTAVRGGTGVVMLAVSPAGQLRRLQSDIDRMLETMVVPR